MSAPVRTMVDVPPRHRAASARKARRAPIADPWGSRQAEAARVAELEAARATTATSPMQVGIESPFPHTSSLSSIVWPDLLGAGVELPMTRQQAMAVPALARQRHILCGTTARCPLVVFAGDQPVDPAGWRWAYRTDGQLPPYHRMLWTVDDLLFTGWSLWRTTRGYDPGAGTPELLAADRVPLERWEVEQQTGFIKVDGEYVDARDVILIPGPHEGILNFGAATLRRMVDNLDAAANAARNPSAYLELHYDGEEPLTADQILELRTTWAEARRGEFSGVAFTGRNLTVIEHGTHESHLLIEGRNADAVDASRMVSSPSAMADATNAGASLTYETTAGRNTQFVDYGVGLYMDAIAARLSMDDVVPRGQRTTFDTTQLTVATPSGTGAPTND